MANLTVSIDENLIRRARVRAINEGTSVSARIREFVADYAQGSDRRKSAGEAFLAAARRSTANSEGASWSRDDANDRVVGGREASGS
ncbi:hypothetical protein ACSFA3_01265 [Variovorax sp. RHLX14]|uniref:hypothetical protein n=1 Tax=Variovorax sp. RHLX14 TaxID=1259731 RepID=UPI003F45F441